MKMKTIRLTWIALSIAALLVVAIAPAASAACSGNGCLKGTYALRLDTATGLDADLAADGDPGNVSGAPVQNVMQAGLFTANGRGTITAGETLATIDDNNGNTDLIDFTWNGTYSIKTDLPTDLIGSLSTSPGSYYYWKCYDMTNLSSTNPSGSGPPDWSPNTSYLNWPNQIMPIAGNAGNFVYQPVTPPDWSAKTYYKNLYTSTVQIFPTQGNSGNDAFRRSPRENWAKNTAYAVGFQIVPAAANNPGGYLFQVTTAGTSGATEPATFNQTVGGTTTETGGLTWTNENGILGRTGAAEPSWPSSPTPVALSTSNASTFTVDGGIMWINEGQMGISGSTEPTTWNQVGQLTNDGGITWAFVGNSSLTPVACNPAWEGAENYSISLSLTHGKLEMVETDNSAGGAKIFMTGEAVKR